METANLFKHLPEDLTDEVFENICHSDTVKIERIVSKGHTTPKNKWYDQDKNEWVIVLKGAARIIFEDQPEVHLQVGDYMNIPKHVRHQVSWTSNDEETIWLAVHYA